MATGLDDLVAAARAGDRKAFEDLVVATSAATYTLALRLTGNEEDARDVVQDAYIRAYRGLGGFRQDASFTTWLYRITANCAHTQRERRRRHAHEAFTDDDQVADLRVEHRPEDALANVELRGELGRGLARLPEKLREVIVLRDIYDLPHEAIAEELGISQGAAKVRLHRARRRLRTELLGWGGTTEAQWRTHEELG